MAEAINLMDPAKFYKEQVEPELLRLCALCEKQGIEFFSAVRIDTNQFQFVIDDPLDKARTGPQTQQLIGTRVTDLYLRLGKR